MAVDLFAKMTTYVRVIEAGSLSAAARQLRVSAAAVSRQIATLEDEVGTQLVARTTRRMAITSAGQRYYERCLRILRDVDDAQAIGSQVGLEGSLRLSVPVTFGLASVVPHLRTLVAKHPALRLDLRLEDRMTDLVLDGVDVAVRVGAVPISTEIVAHKLYSWRRILVAAPSYLKRRGTPKTPAALARHPALSHAVDVNVETWALVNGDRTERVRVDVRCTSNAGHVLLELAVDGAGIAMLPPWFVTEQLSRRQLRVVLPEWTSELLTAHALYRAQHRGEQRVRTLVEHLRAAYAQP